MASYSETEALIGKNGSKNFECRVFRDFAMDVEILDVKCKCGWNRRFPISENDSHLTKRIVLKNLSAEDGQEWQAYIQKSSMEQKDLANNIAAIHLWINSRCLNIRRGVETPAEAFGAHLIKGSNIPPSWGEHFLGLKLNLLEAPRGK